MTTTPLTIRCSSLPLAWKCPSSQYVNPGEPVLNSTSEPAEMGNAFHRWIAAHIGGTELDQTSLAAEHVVDLEELKMLCAMGVIALKKLRSMLDACDGPLQTEVSLMADLGDGLTIAGSADLMGRQKRVGLFLDWKTGRVDTDFVHQKMGYAYAGMEKLATKVPLDIDEVVLITVWVREGFWDTDRFTVAQLKSWAEELKRRIRNGRGNYNPSGHCLYCPRQAACPGRRALVQATMADFSIDGVKVMEWTPQTRAEMAPQIGQAYAMARLVESAVDRFRFALKDDIREHGPLPIGGGRQIGISKTNLRKLDPAKARPVLLEYLNQEEIDRATTISLSECERLAIADEPHGGKGKVKKALTADLESAGALSIEVTESLREGKEQP